MYCNQCGTELPDDSKFCSNCGAKVADALQTKLSATDTAPPMVDAVTAKQKGSINKKPFIIIAIIAVAIVAIILFFSLALDNLVGWFFTSNTQQNQLGQF